MALLCSLAGLALLGPAYAPSAVPQKWTGLQWPQQLDDPTWKPRIGYLRNATCLAGQPLVGPQLRLAGLKGKVEWTLESAPGGMKVDASNRIVWPAPVEGRYLIRVIAQNQGEIEEADWHLCVLRPLSPDTVLHSTRHMDFVIPKANAEWMQTSGADKVVDAYYEFGRDLVGGLPSDCRQSMLYDPAMGGAHSSNPIVVGGFPLGDNTTNNWRLGFLFHELGHNLNGGWTRVGHIEHGDGLADGVLHDMVEFDKIAWVLRMLKSPTTQGVVDVPKFVEWMNFEKMEFVGSFDTYMEYVAKGGNFLKFKDGQSAPWAGMIHRYAFEYGPEALEKVILAIRRDGIPLPAYPQGEMSASERFTIVMCAMSNAAGRDLRKWFVEAGMPLDVELYSQMYPKIARAMTNLPAMGKNGAYKCPADGKYYLLTPYPTTWAVAEATARRIGGHLVTIRSAAQELWLSNKFAPDGWLWVGYRRKAADGPWKWVTGETTAPPLWEPERPETDPAKTCGVLIMHEERFKIPWCGLANRPPDEHLFGIIELDRPPAVDVDGLQ